MVAPNNKLIYDVLIETLWNVKWSVIAAALGRALNVLIETLWNVKILHRYRSSNIQTY